MHPKIAAHRTQEEAYSSWIPDQPSRWFLTCDHASARLPAPLRWPSSDLGWVGQHWSYDLGAAALAQELSYTLGAPLVMSRFSRLLVDPNRKPEDTSFILPAIEGQPITLNQELSASQRSWRQREYYENYHLAIAQALCAHQAKRPKALLLSLHTFTPVYQGEVRRMPGGVLFDAHEALAKAFCAGLIEQGWAFEENAPYSGYAGLIHGVARHGNAVDCPYLELEVRQDLACNPVTRGQLVRAIAAVCRALG